MAGPSGTQRFGGVDPNFNPLVDLTSDEGDGGPIATGDQPPIATTTGDQATGTQPPGLAAEATAVPQSPGSPDIPRLNTEQGETASSGTRPGLFTAHIGTPLR